MRSVLAAWMALVMLSGLAVGQTIGENIDLYFSDWHSLAPHTSPEGLSVRDIYTKGDPQHPAKKGAVLRYINSYTYATLEPRTSTNPARLDGRQQIFFVLTGRGTASAGGETAEMFPNVAVLMPGNLEFTLQNTGDTLLAMYVIEEPTPAGFRRNANMLVRDENKIPITASDGHWSHIVKTLYTTQDGLGTLEAVLTVTLDPLTVGKPHVVDHDDIEEVWTSLYGTSLAFVGNQLRRQTPGMSFYHIPDNKTPHSNINQNEDAQVKFLYFGRYHPHETRK
jgi:mannose-6-phosphate isomerase-like protein (cupin superfamily)